MFQSDKEGSSSAGALDKSNYEYENSKFAGTKAVESEGLSTWGVGENFNEFDSRLTFRSPIVSVCATSVSVTLGKSKWLSISTKQDRG